MSSRKIPRLPARTFFYLAAAAAHIILIISLSFSVAGKEASVDYSIFKVVDIAELTAEDTREEKEKVEPPKPDDVIEVETQDGPVEDIEATDKTVMEVREHIEYLPQHKISDPPGIPVHTVRERIVYPSLANRQGIEGIVYLELYIDASGKIRNIKVLKDPGHGLAEAAVKALEGIVCVPARANGTAVAVRFRYPVRFALN